MRRLIDCARSPVEDAMPLWIGPYGRESRGNSRAGTTEMPLK